jgi:hypothetical protein
LQVVRCVRVCRQTRTRGCTCFIARETGKRREKNSSRTGSRVPTGTREAHSTRDGIRWDKRSKRDGDRKSGGRQQELFFFFAKKKSRPKSESIARAFSHANRITNAKSRRSRHYD